MTEDRLVRIRDIVGDRSAVPPIQGIVPVSEAGWRAGVREGKFPKPIKLGTRTICWRLSDVMAVVTHGPIRTQREAVAA